MLPRAARQRSHLRHAQSVAEHLQLPFLCPAISRSDRRPSPYRPITTRTKPNLSRPPKSLSHSRQLASAAPLPEAFERDDDYSSPTYAGRDLFPSHLALSDPVISQPFDLRDVIHLDTTTIQPPEVRNFAKTSVTDIKGNVNEVERNFEACLLLRKWHRASAALRQLRLLHYTDTDRLRFQFNRMLAHLVDDLIETPSSDQEERITQWIEKDMKLAGLQPDAHTFALVIKATLASSGRSKRERTVRRYWDMARRYNVQSEVGGSRAILSDRDLGMISEICPLEAEDWRELSASDPEIDVVDVMVAENADLQLKETEQKGMGLFALRQTLALFSDAEDKDRLMMENDKKSRSLHATERQRRLETDAIESAVSRWKIEHEKLARIGINSITHYGKLGALLWQWHEILTKKINEELKRVQEAELSPRKSPSDKLRLEYGPFLALLNPAKLAAATVIAMVQIMSRFGSTKAIRLVQLVTDLGRAIENEHEAVQVQERKRRDKKSGRMADAFGQGDNSPLREPSATHLARRSWHPAAPRFLWASEWTTGIHAKLGSILCELTFDAARIPVTKRDAFINKDVTIAQPAFMRKRMFLNGKHISTVSLHESFVEILSAMPATYVIAKQLPMLCPPRPWTGYKDGGYLESNLPVLRVKNGEALQKDYVVAAAARGDLDPIFAGLDVLGSTAWRINPKVFEVMAKAWNRGEATANLPPLNKVFDYPQRPPSEASRKQKFDWYQQVRAIENEKSGVHSERCFQNFQMEIARAYLHETFYLPHNMDFRGRAYPIPPYLNQMAADNCRGLLTFAKGRELGQEGLRWLQIHLSNVYGYDKASLSDRAQFPMDHLDEIRDSVANPLDGGKWWQKAEDPWQCLATCFELVGALDSPNPATFVSHLPVHQDGSCNGLQHYAALGGDLAGARQVNLEPGAKPADVYSGVADLVRAEVAKDVAEGHEIARALDGRVTRKMVKQTVMTNVYGVTFLGAIRQVRKQVDDLYPDLGQRQISGLCSAYVARKIFKALGSLFTGAHEIQYWLGDCANRITGSLSPAQLQEVAEKEWGEAIETNAEVKRKRRKGQQSAGVKKQEVKRNGVKKTVLDPWKFRSSVVWTTPLKLPVVQPYREHKGTKIQTSLQGLTLVEPSAADGVNRKKQLQAFPPNFIHSLDATHMQLSALKAHEMGLTFAAVHDSFWSHAADVGVLSKLLREAFIRMHSEDIIGRLHAEFRTRYEGHVYLGYVLIDSPLGQALGEYRQRMMEEGSLPPGRSLVAQRKRKYAELLREIKKGQLMKSEDETERAQGEAMMTASTLFQQFGGEQYIYSKDSLGATAMGAVPEGGEKESLEANSQPESHELFNADNSVLAESNDNETIAEMDEDAAEEEDTDEALTAESTESQLEVDGSDDASDSDAGASATQNARKRKKTAQGPTLAKSTFAWLPLTFRPVPQKGEFDVTRLRDSMYFFS